MPQLPATARSEIAPDWVCEILSPSTIRDDRVIKMPLYARESVGHIWLIDPDQKNLEVYGLHDEYWFLLGVHKDDEQVSSPPFEVLELGLSALWP
jgi:Uma2 family endonuclease